MHTTTTITTLIEKYARRFPFFASAPDTLADGNWSRHWFSGDPAVAPEVKGWEIKLRRPVTSDEKLWFSRHGFVLQQGRWQRSDDTDRISPDFKILLLMPDEADGWHVFPSTLKDRLRAFARFHNISSIRTTTGMIVDTWDGHEWLS
jgi:hypothetical protein